MAFEEDIETVSAKSGGDYSAASNQYKLVKISGVNTVTLCDNLTDAVYGVLQNLPKTNEAATIAIAGRSKCQASAAVTAGQLVGTTTAGLGHTAETSNKIVGIAVTSCSNAGELFVLQIDKQYVA